MTIPGLPQGVELVRIGVAEAEDFELTSDAGAHAITKGPRAGSMAQVIVRPVAGWTFVPFFDARMYRQVFVPSQALAAPEETVLKFVATSTFEKEKIAQAVEAAKTVPGFVAS